MYIFSSYRAVNTLRLGYKTYIKKIIAVISESYKTDQQTTVCGQNGEFLNFNISGT